MHESKLAKPIPTSFSHYSYTIYNVVAILSMADTVCLPCIQKL